MPIASDTIFARASGAGRAGVAVFRVSGPAALSIARSLAGRPPVPKRAALRRVRNAKGELIDEGLVILFKAPASLTGEDVAEFQLHGSAAVEAALYEALSALGARPAEAGEFARRALLNGKLDLAEIEGLADLLDAETAEQRKQALGQLSGRLSAVAEAWRKRLIAILAPLEAAIDFPDEADVPAEIAARAAPEIEALLAELRSYRARSEKARAVREGVKVAIIGAPNAGKSSLLNRLAGSERAIVAATPGTTRDVIEARLDLSGMLVSLFDTAGLRAEAGDGVEAEGMRRTRMKAAEADLRMLIVDVSREEGGGGAAEGLLRPGDFVVFNKIDLVSGRDGVSVTAHGGREGVPPLEKGGRKFARRIFGGDQNDMAAADPPADHAAHDPTPPFQGGESAPGQRAFRVSARTGEGLDSLLSGLSAAVAARGDGEGALLTRVRHVAAVEKAIGHLKSAGARLEAAELAAEDVRLAARELGKITGAVGVEDVLDAIFSSFCIGK